MGRGFSHNGKTLLSGIDPAGKADQIADMVSLSDRTLYLCPSPLYGYGLERLLSRISPVPDTALLCIEADPVLYSLSLEHISPAIKNNPAFRLTNQCEAGTLCALLRQEWGTRFFRKIEIVRLNGGWQLFPVLYETLAESLRSEIALEWGNAITLARLGRLYIRNALRNLALIPRCPSLQQLSFGNDPVLVMGAGPSLDNVLDNLQTRFGTELQQIDKRNFRIICADTCLTALQERGITPDLVVILESQHWNLGDFIGLSGSKITAAMDISALPQSGIVPGGDLYLFFTPWTKLAIFKRLENASFLPMPLPPMGSVGLSAVSIARQLTSGMLITAGLDFSFTLDSYHARSTPGHKRKLNSQNRLTGLLNAKAAFGSSAYSVISKNGSPVYSTPAMRKYRDIFEREFASGGRIADISGSGLPLGIETLSPEAAFEILSGKNDKKIKPQRTQSVKDPDFSGKLPEFIQCEKNRLLQLRDLLTGKLQMDYDKLETLISECDYLWAHFPDYAASDHRLKRAMLQTGDPAAISFLKRVRVEIDPFLKIWELTERNL